MRDARIGGRAGRDGHRARPPHLDRGRPGRRDHAIARRGYEEFERLVGDAYRLVSECPCESGCPSCVQSPKCGNLNEPLAKNGALEVMALMLER